MRLINTRLISAWLFGISLSYYLLGFFSNFHTTDLDVVFLTLVFHSGVSLFFYYSLGMARKQFQHDPVDLGLTAVLFIVLLSFALRTFEMAKQFTSLFDPSYFHLEKTQLVYFVSAVIPALPISALLLSLAPKKQLKQTLAFQALERNLSGLLIASLFFIVYLILASIFNRPIFDVDDIFFDTDGLLWRTRLTTNAYQDYYWRSVHPFVLLIIRPLITLIAFSLNGDKLSAAFVLVAFSGALCVFLAWYFIKHMIGNSIYALLIASLLGASAAHLVFGSLIETYIFLAATTMIFLVFLLKDQPLLVLIITGAASFGITITNFASTVIAFLFIKRNLKQWISYGLLVSMLIFPITLLNNLVYPNSQPYFFTPSSLNAETGNTFSPTIERASAIVRVMFLHSIVAPVPLVFKAEIPFLKVWMSKFDPIQLSKYQTWFGKTLAYFWLGLIVLGATLFLKNLYLKRTDNRFPLAFICILFFNFVLHLLYGKDIFLYSTNWTYAIILFLALAWKDLADKRWFQLVLFIFLGLLLFNNSHLFLTMLTASATHIK